MLDKLTSLACWAPIMQAVFTFLVAMFSGFWSITIYLNEVARIEHQKKLDRREAQKDAIMRMNLQLTLMKVQCPTDRPLRNLPEVEKTTILDKGCHDAYIGAYSLLVLSKMQILPGPDVGDKKWAQLWDNLEHDLRGAGTMQYIPSIVSKSWEIIVNESETL